MNNIKYNCEEQLEMVSRNYSRLANEYEELKSRFLILKEKYDNIAVLREREAASAYLRNRFC